MPTSAASRFARGAVVGIVTVILGTTSHVLAGGAAPSQVMMLAICAFAILGASALMGSQVSLPRLALMTVGGQALLHHALVLGSGAGHHTHGSAPIELSILQAGHADALSAASVQMTIMHAVAALGAAWWLARGERVVWTLIGLLASSWAGALRWALTRFTPPMASRSTPSLTRSITNSPRLHQQVWNSGTCDRGPPLRGPIRRVAVV